MKRLTLIVAALALGLAACGGSGKGTGAGSGGHVNVVIWHGYTGPEATAIKKLAAEFNATHPKITVTPQFDGSNDYTLQKVTAAVAGGKPPDIAYLYGSWAANIASSPGVVTLNGRIASDPSLNWNDIWPSARAVTTVNGKIIGVPALVDNLALVYNKTLFAKAGLAPPTAQWTWGDFETAAEKLTNVAAKQFGWAYVNDGSEDTVWRFWALLWQAGGHILSPNGKQAAFDSPAGIKAMSMLQTLAGHHSIYLDNGSDNYLGLFTAGHIGMLFTGPWDLSTIAASSVKYGVQILPGDLNHQTISGPDNWVIFNNGSARVQAAWQFLTWLTSPAVDIQWCLMTGDLPLRRSVISQSGYAEYTKRYPGIAVWVQNLANATQARPILAIYPRISTVIGQAVQSVLLGKASPSQALSTASQSVNGLLNVPS